MSNHGHFMKVCSCGAMIEQCRCYDPNKKKTIIENGCKECRDKLNLKHIKGCTCDECITKADSNLQVKKADESVEMSRIKIQDNEVIIKFVPNDNNSFDFELYNGRNASAMASGLAKTVLTVISTADGVKEMMGIARKIARG